MVEELLETFICIVDTKLFKGIVLKDFETSDIEDTNKVVFLHVITQSSVNYSDKPVEETTKDGLGKGSKGKVTLINSLTLCDIFSTDFDLW